LHPPERVLAMMVIVIVVMVMRPMAVIMINRVGHLVIVMVLVAVVVQFALLSCFLQFRFKHPPDRRVFSVFFYLLHFAGNTETLREVSFRDREITCDSRAGIKVLVVPEERRRNNRSGLPVHLHGLGLVAFQTALSCQ